MYVVEMSARHKKHHSEHLGRSLTERDEKMQLRTPVMSGLILKDCHGVLAKDMYFLIKSKSLYVGQ
jgi:hypothetical protein